MRPQLACIFTLVALVWFYYTVCMLCKLAQNISVLHCMTVWHCHAVQVRARTRPHMSVSPTHDKRIFSQHGDPGPLAPSPLEHFRPDTLRGVQPVYMSWLAPCRHESGQIRGWSKKLQIDRQASPQDVLDVFISIINYLKVQKLFDRLPDKYHLFCICFLLRSIKSDVLFDTTLYLNHPLIFVGIWPKSNFGLILCHISSYASSSTPHPRQRVSRWVIHSFGPGLA